MKVKKILKKFGFLPILIGFSSFNGLKTQAMSENSKYIPIYYEKQINEENDVYFEDSEDDSDDIAYSTISGYDFDADKSFCKFLDPQIGFEMENYWHYLKNDALQEKKVDIIKKHKYEKNNMFDGKEKTYITNDLKIYSDGDLELNFNFMFGYNFQKYKLDFDKSIEEKDVKIRFFKNEESYKNNSIAMVKNVVPLKTTVNGGEFSNVLIYRFGLNLNEIKQLLCENRLYFKMKIGLENESGKDYGKFIEIDYEKLKKAVLNGLFVFYEEKEVDYLNNSIDKIKKQLTNAGFSQEETGGFLAKLEELIKKKAKKAEKAKKKQNEILLNYSNRLKDETDSLLDKHEKEANFEDKNLNSLKKRKKELDFEIDNLIENEESSGLNDEVKKTDCCSKIKNFIKEMCDIFSELNFENLMEILNPKRTYFCKYLNKENLMKHEQNKKSSKLEAIIGSILKLKVCLSCCEEKEKQE